MIQYEVALLQFVSCSSLGGLSWLSGMEVSLVRKVRDHLSKIPPARLHCDGCLASTKRFSLISTSPCTSTHFTALLCTRLTLPCLAIWRRSAQTDNSHPSPAQTHHQPERQSAEQAFNPLLSHHNRALLSRYAWDHYIYTSRSYSENSTNRDECCTTR